MTMRLYTYRVTYSASGVRRIEFPGTNPIGKRLTLVIPLPKQVCRSRAKLKRPRGVEYRDDDSHKGHEGV